MSKSPAPQSKSGPNVPLRHSDTAPDSRAGRSDIAPDAVPDDLRRRDQRDAPPDSLPRSREDEVPIAGHSAAPDGGIAQHPIHDEPEQDFTPRDYERQIDDVADELRAKARRAGVKDTDKVSEER